MWYVNYTHKVDNIIIPLKEKWSKYQKKVPLGRLTKTNYFPQSDFYYELVAKLKHEVKGVIIILP